MRKSPFILIPILIMSILLLFATLNQKRLFNRVSRANVYQQCRPPPSFFNAFSVNVPDYVLNFKQPIQLPLHCIPYSTIRGRIPICIHDNKEYFTYEIYRIGSWESGHVDRIQTILDENPDYGLIDIGKNLGMFSLLAANLQRPALAVEAMDINIGKVHQSVVINRFEEYITLVTRPLSDKHETLKFVVSKSNLGASILVTEKAPTIKGTLHYENKTTLMLDDLIDLMARKRALMVIDVEGNGGKVIRGGQKFFDAIDISHVFMGSFNLSDGDKEYLLDFFLDQGYEPYNSPMFLTKLDTSEFKKWGQNVFWKK